MKVVYRVTHSKKRWVVLFSAESLEAVAEAILAQPDPEAMDVYASSDFTRELSVGERERLDELLASASKPRAPVARR
ncbi:MAG TPA: hypothetical protein VNS09_16110 [Solirubrobacter sp.]|nr:hypothetical protein [Solirubrobacter sp.]